MHPGSSKSAFLSGSIFSTKVAFMKGFAVVLK